ncbi:MAG: hypothetical protein EOS07_29480 [Mesorhizobium sp.]|nr:MAG: hypothetical protein EOS07_29480 [Mesorhizobium sp.]
MLRTSLLDAPRILRDISYRRDMSSIGSRIGAGEVQFSAHRCAVARIWLLAFDVNYIESLVQQGLLAHRFSLWTGVLIGAGPQSLSAGQEEMS